MTLTAEAVADWSYVKDSCYSRPVPAMPKEERTAWIELSHARMTRRLGADEFKLLMALDRKVKFRARFDRA